MNENPMPFSTGVLVGSFTPMVGIGVPGSSVGVASRVAESGCEQPTRKAPRVASPAVRRNSRREREDFRGVFIGLSLFVFNSIRLICPLVMCYSSFIDMTEKILLFSLIDLM
jgi:hypothetical protein